MKKSKQSRKNPSLDLFGGVIVTWDDVNLWMEKIVRLPRDSPRWAYYVKYWNVPDRIKAAKLAGTFDRLTE